MILMKTFTWYYNNIHGASFYDAITIIYDKMVIIFIITIAKAHVQK